MCSFQSPKPSDEKVLVTLDMHPEDYTKLAMAAMRSGMAIRDFALLGLHFFTDDVLKPVYDGPALTRTASPPRLDIGDIFNELYVRKEDRPPDWQ